MGGRLTSHEFSSQPWSLGSSAIVKVLGQNDPFVFWGSLQQMAFASQKVLWSVPQTQFFTLVSQSPADFWANGCCFRKGSVEVSANYSLHLSPKWMLLHKSSLEGSANCALHLSPSLLLGSKWSELLTCPPHTNPVRRKRPIMSLLLGILWAYSLVNPNSTKRTDPPIHQCHLWKKTYQIILDHPPNSISWREVKFWENVFSPKKNCP